MTLTESEVEHIAELARIKLTENEKEKMAENLGQVLSYINRLNKIDTKNVEPAAQVTGTENIFRVDEPKREFNRQKIIAGFPHKKDDYLKVKPVFEEKE